MIQHIASTLACSVAVVLTLPSSAALLYSTTFEEFETGPDRISQVDGWKVSSQGQSLHGIDEDAVPGLGKSGYLGRNSPSTDLSFVSVWRPVSFDPIAAGAPVVEFFAIVGIADSTNGKRDNFYLSFYDTGNKLLGAVNFDNTKERFGIWRYDGKSYHRTSGAFFRGKVHELYIRINYATGSWSAELDYLPLFRDVPIDFTGKTKTIGSFAAEWEITDPSAPGNNWLLFDEWTAEISHTPEVSADFAFDPGSSELKVAWEIDEIGYSYRIEKSVDLSNWKVVEIVNPEHRGTSGVALSIEDPFCFYRLKRSVFLSQPSG